ncbi:DUF4214 domain-containing protein [Candidatus Njordibacter sp. Uisw_058]|jgi:hypothetical protein|uniref:DUF4214 domain-containing protein n=1 Tax=Candidatus Njordibacter sp. Uisw_058 TaxID=3230974 RepID=UPI003D5A3062
MAAAASEKQVQELFIAYFGRPADAGGLAFYANALDSGTQIVNDIASGFAGSDEAAAVVALETERYVESVYSQAFGREYNPQTDGTFWVDSIESGAYTKEIAMLSILNGASGSDATAVENKGKVAATYSAAQKSDKKDYSGSAVDAAKAVLSAVTADAETLTAGTSAASKAIDDAAPLDDAGTAVLVSVIATAEAEAAAKAEALAVAATATASAAATKAGAEATAAANTAAKAALAVIAAIAGGDAESIAAARTAETAAAALVAATTSAVDSAMKVATAQLAASTAAKTAALGAQNAFSLATIYSDAVAAGDAVRIEATKLDQAAASLYFDTSYDTYTNNIETVSFRDSEYKSFAADAAAAAAAVNNAADTAAEAATAFVTAAMTTGDAAATAAAIGAVAAAMAAVTAAEASIAPILDPVAIAIAAQAARVADPNYVDPALADPNYIDPVAGAIAAAVARAADPSYVDPYAAAAAAEAARADARAADPDNYVDPYAAVRADFASRGEVYISPDEAASAAHAAAFPDFVSPARAAFLAGEAAKAAAGNVAAAAAAAIAAAGGVVDPNAAAAVTAALGLLGGAAAVADPNYADPYATVRADFASRGEVYFSPAEKATAASAAASIASAALIDPVAVAMAAQAARAADPNYVDPALNNPDYVDPVAFAIAAANTRASAVKSAPNSNRFESEADAITYAQNSGQGALKVSSDGAIINQYGETMVYDSSGNLAPASRATPVADNSVAEVATAADPSATYSSRFENEADAITYAQNSGQGALEVSSDGAITNQYGETMVTDSDGNLAPAPRATPVADEAAANAAIADSRADAAAAALAEAMKLLSYSVSDIGTSSTDLAPTPFATAESSASLQVLGVPEFNLSTDLFI